MASKVGVARPQDSRESLYTWRSSAFDGIVFSRGAHFTHPYPRHWHEEIHFCAYTAGSGYLGCRGNSHLVAAGDFVITPPAEVHENWLAPGSDISFCGAYVDVASFRKATTQITEREVRLPQSVDWFSPNKLLNKSFLALCKATERLASRLQQDELLLEFVRALVSTSTIPKCFELRAGNEPGAIKRAREFIDAHFTEPISLASLSQLTSLSPYHLHRVFSQQTGMPPHAYQTQVRINRAKQLLRDRLPLSAIAADTGFADQSHLTRHFRRLVGVTPGRFLA
jgi:AraC-like DNA-binding protein